VAYSLQKIASVHDENEMLLALISHLSLEVMLALHQPYVGLWSW
jgi:hypothetical protein